MRRRPPRRNCWPSFPGVRHVYLASGSCLPLRPVDELRAYLAARPMTDFIESVTIRDVDWTVGGLNDERFNLRFPFSWKRHRFLFDRYVELQRKVGFKRKIPEGVVPHLGSQWWCLTRQTLTAILEDPRRREIERYFRLVWIPDESYYQTLVAQLFALDRKPVADAVQVRLPGQAACLLRRSPASSAALGLLLSRARSGPRRTGSTTRS